MVILVQCGKSPQCKLLKLFQTAYLLVLSLTIRSLQRLCQPQFGGWPTTLFHCGDAHMPGGMEDLKHKKCILKKWCSLYIEIQGTTPNFCPKNLGILVSGMGQLQGVFGT